MSTEQATTTAAGEAVTPAQQTSVPVVPSGEVTTPPTETPQPQEGAEQTTGEPAPEQAGEGKEKDQGRFGRRIQQLTAKNASLRRDLETANARLAQMERSSREPANADELTYDQREELRLQRALDRRDANRDRDAIREISRETHETRAELFRAKCEAVADRLPENFYQDFGSLSVTPDMAEFIANSDVAPELAVYLTKNRAEADRLSELTDPRRATRASLREADQLMARMESRLQRAPKVRQATTAPNPGTTLNGGAPPPAAKTLAEEDDMEKYAERRHAAWKKGQS